MTGLQRGLPAFVILGALAASIAGAGCAPASGARALTMEGEIIDPQCWFTHGGEGLSHRDCALMCARGGQSLGFVNRAGQRFYPIIAATHGVNPNDSLYAVVGYPVIVHGTLFTRGGQEALVVARAERIGGAAAAESKPGAAAGSDEMKSEMHMNMSNGSTAADSAARGGRRVP
ncbi:MAG: hypothetical protein HY076_04915 [Candidatus Eisenbacteria bacterium]|uniref:Uncharacterized protein n=1 Tax=Eiseniibacteriota bacterium TaxID=2212470 RepID=A0A9D6L633_UNCEI|nr:hypothetical protein [Candidatus Eisenbacteria bacterium]MBI3539593.1 hypothetical protein [Candidatus Eisenbacteria bacterium]